MVIRGKTEEFMPDSLDAEVRLSSRTIRLGSFAATSTGAHQSSRNQLIGAPGGASSTFPISRVWAQRYWPIGRVVLQLSAAAAMLTQNEGIALMISGIAMMAEITQDRSMRSR